MIELDGAAGEGGGQILRTSLSLSLITGQAFHLRNVRAKRAKPGLQAQHLTGVRAAAAIGQAQVRGASIGSTDLLFEPGPVSPGKYHFAIGTAGATALVLHTLYLPLALAGGTSELTLEGGTHVRAAPCFHFLDVTWRAYMALLGLDIKLRLLRPGFFPRGGGLVQATIAPCGEPRPWCLEESPVASRGQILSAVAGLPPAIAQRQSRRASKCLRDLKLQVEVQEESWPGGPGTLLAITLNTVPVPTLLFGLGERGKPAERVADEAADQIADFLTARRAAAAVDVYSGDQLLLPLSLAKGASQYRVAAVTSHLQTNVAVIRKFVDRLIEIDGDKDDSGTVTIR